MKATRRALVPALFFAFLANSAHAAAPDTEAVEFYNTKLNHFFVTANAAEARGIDAGAAGPGWVRTGRSFQAWTTRSAAPATASPVCRFYSTGANSHFYTASASECAALRALEATERSQGSTRGWGYEGTAFYIQAPASAGACPAGTTALGRAYNNGFTNGEGSNHRFIDDGSLAELMADQGWTVEGVVMCAVSKRHGGNANLPPTTDNFEALAGSWTGSARWKSENRGMETRTNEPLSLAIAADGAVSGTGFGCTFTGSVLQGDGFRSHFKGELSATGCTVESFNGDYNFLHLQVFGGDQLVVHAKRGHGAVEARIDATLLADTTEPPPPAGGFAAIEGPWLGTVAWNAVQTTLATNVAVTTSVNQEIALQISATGAITGTGFGCTFTGTLAEADAEGDFLGTAEATGCTDPLFNGAYASVKVNPEDGGSIEVELERESEDATTRVEVEIEGLLLPAA